jgi:ATP-dependent DNA helicase RecG
MDPPPAVAAAALPSADLERPLDMLPGVGKTIRARLAKLGLRTVRDLVEHAPFRYVGARPISSLFGEVDEVSIEGTVGPCREAQPRGRRLTIVEATISDDSGRSARPGSTSRGWPSSSSRDLACAHRDVAPRRLRGSRARAGDRARRSRAGLSGRRGRDAEEAARARARGAVARRPRSAASTLKERHRLPLKVDALRALHRPRSADEAELGRTRLAFEELLVLQLGIARAARAHETSVARALGEPGELIARYREVLPFTLTEHQERAIAEIDADLARTVPMQRLLQGDVGSGKTVVALHALLRASRTTRRARSMAPTETLAEQHFLTIAALCAQLGVRVALLTGSVKKRSRRDIVVGTHALIQEGIELRGSRRRGHRRAAPASESSSARLWWRVARRTSCT